MSSELDLKYWLALARVPFFGAVRLGKLFRAFPDMERAFCASKEELIAAEIEPDIAHRFLLERTHIDPDAELDRLQKAETQVATLADANYPKLLKQITDPPALLFYRGTLPSGDRKHIAVVGSREATDYGRRAIETIIGPLASAGAVIVSGLAYGIDAHAHKVTIGQGGTTIAVLGSGIDYASIYPSGNRALGSEILASGGALISEFPIGTNPLKHHFPMRNRVIAGLCHGTLVVEAAQKSGSLITAKYALETGRDVYAIPGSIDAPLSEGPNNLIKMGAFLITQACDIMPMIENESTTGAGSGDPTHSLSSDSKNKIVYQPRNETERMILSFLSTQPVHVDEISHACILPIDAISSTLTLLEMKGVIRHEGGRTYVRVMSI